VPARYADVQKSFFPRAETMVMEGCGHWPFVDNPEAVTSAVVLFIRRQVQESDDT
jgi:pimeloyl-ACP methyl ester carboxylesterase